MPQLKRVGREPVPLASHQPRSWRPQLTVAIVLGVLGSAVYANSFQAPFVFDSVEFIRDNRSIQRVWPWLVSLGGDQSLGGNRPVGFLSFALNFACHGTDVW